jgi:hypothetical protein
MEASVRAFRPTGVYYCGSVGFAETVTAVCKEVDTPFHQEVFQDVTLGSLIPW